ncbi:hypothetical protein TBLA_0B07670 [Henningerozyma blattae CBS 6284]|uniref:Protein FYV8 n=1 Tax=Henningerozyma blattae (strain ATCC 34711 / CBS 6284 / DSM 70876 / NBRC 10599 / NRRL Y-10934 / UCD 77-7) TaxID=1071380 RepID=I2GZN1_HENB6|nr:hypothetical protein TBLA_0B07670 [Tetrapisispora blattae CBS 6284]CCH59583.1 hypothetical protein TBLA_0B07670 [Tetrapisispora blattae CBS 6284]
MSDNIGRKKSYRWVSASTASYDGADWDSSDEESNSISRNNTINKLPELPKLGYASTPANQIETIIENDIEETKTQSEIAHDNIDNTFTNESYNNSNCNSTSNCEQDQDIPIKPEPLKRRPQPLKSSATHNTSIPERKHSNLQETQHVKEDLDSLMNQISDEMNNEIPSGVEVNPNNYNDIPQESDEFSVSKEGYFSKFVDSDGEDDKYDLDNDNTTKDDDNDNTQIGKYKEKDFRSRLVPDDDLESTKSMSYVIGDEAQFVAQPEQEQEKEKEQGQEIQPQAQIQPQEIQDNLKEINENVYSSSHNNSYEDAKIGKHPTNNRNDDVENYSPVNRSMVPSNTFIDEKEKGIDSATDKNVISPKKEEEETDSEFAHESFLDTYGNSSDSDDADANQSDNYIDEQQLNSTTQQGYQEPVNEPVQQGLQNLDSPSKNNILRHTSKTNLQYKSGYSSEENTENNDQLTTNNEDEYFNDDTLSYTESIKYSPSQQQQQRLSPRNIRRDSSDEDVFKFKDIKRESILETSDEDKKENSENELDSDNNLIRPSKSGYFKKMVDSDDSDSPANQIYDSSEEEDFIERDTMNDIDKEETDKEGNKARETSVSNVRNNSNKTMEDSTSKVSEPTNSVINFDSSDEDIDTDIERMNSSEESDVDVHFTSKEKENDGKEIKSPNIGLEDTKDDSLIDDEHMEHDTSSRKSSKEVDGEPWKPDTDEFRSQFVQDTSNNPPPGYVYDGEGNLIDLTPASMKNTRVVSTYTDVTSQWNAFPSNGGEEVATIRDTATIYDNNTIYNVPGLISNQSNLPPLPADASIVAATAQAEVDSAGTKTAPPSITPLDTTFTQPKAPTAISTPTVDTPLTSSTTIKSGSPSKSGRAGSVIDTPHSKSNATLSSVPMAKSELSTNSLDPVLSGEKPSETQFKEVFHSPESSSNDLIKLAQSNVVPYLDMNKVLSSTISHPSKLKQLNQYQEQLQSYDSGIQIWIKQTMKTNANAEDEFVFKDYKVSHHVRDAYAHADELSKRHTVSVSNTVDSVTHNVNHLKKKVFMHSMNINSKKLFTSIGKKNCNGTLISTCSLVVNSFIYSEIPLINYIYIWVRSFLYGYF